MTLTPRTLLGVAGKVDARNVVVMASLSAAQAADEGLSAVGCKRRQALGNLMIDALDGMCSRRLVHGAASSAITSVPTFDVLAGGIT